METLEPKQEAAAPPAPESAQAPSVADISQEEFQKLLENATIKDVFDVYLPQRMGAAFEKMKDTLAQIQGILQFVVTGEGGGEWYIQIAEGRGEVKPGMNEAPTTTFTVDAADWMALMQRKVDPQMLFMQGKLKITGDMSLAMRLGQLIRSSMGG